jgi:hypothetical protein
MLVGRLVLRIQYIFLGLMKQLLGSIAVISVGKLTSVYTIVLFENLSSLS